MMSECWQLKESWVCKQNHTEHSSGKVTNRKHLCKHCVTMPFGKGMSVVQEEVLFIPSKAAVS